ncbi:cohesin subunit SA-2-like isoform X3 [Varanus komodoensis]|uniref:cohesin subunit SA-2-like isoform X3 n=1 Tax=Varanus komodoensis TaxID=61221 RepID=UPI001CF7E1C4|nr:cohesin subunit SA-2-like isoform X3 [Varanus komodoensis]
MIAEPNSVAHLPNRKEHGIHDETFPEATAEDGNCLRNGSIRTSEEKREIQEQHENRRRNSSSSRQSSQLQNGEEVEFVTLFEVISLGKSAIQSVVDDWVEAYKTDRDVALLDLINFFIQCSGCQGMVTAEMFHNFQNSEVMEKMTEAFDSESGLQYKKFVAYPWILTVTWPVNLDSEDYPLIKPGFWKKFKANFCEFIAVLVQQRQCSILYDGYLMDTIISLLTGLADSVIRAFRHTSTLAAMKLLTALLNANLNLDFEPKPPDTENMMDAIFKGTFLHRYRDVVPEIRAICIEEIGSWMKIDPDIFLHDSYLKYIGWMLYDKHPDVRLKCLQGLQGIYGQKEHACKMELFTCRFKERIVSMTLDIDHEVAVQAMKLLMLMSQNCEDVLSPEEYESLYRFVYASHRPLAVAAGELLYKRLIDQEIEIEVFTKKKGNQKLVVKQLKALIIFFLESELHNHAAYLVDSLWEWDVLKDWECMTDLLLDHEGALSDAQKSALIEIILATVQEAAEGHPLRGGIRKILSTKEKKIQMEDCTKMTEHFIVVLPQLLAKYSVDAEKVTNLLQIPQYFHLELYSAGHMEKHLNALLREVKAIATKHSDTNVLEACSRFYYVLCSGEFAALSKVGLAKTELVNELVDTLNQLLGAFWNDEEGICAEEEEGIHRLCSTLRRIAAFHNAHDLTKWNLYDKMSKMLVFHVEFSPLPVQILLPALECAYFALLWQLTSVMELTSAKENVLVLRTHLKHYCYICTCYLSHYNRELREKAFMIVCDFLMVISHQDSSDDGVLEYLPSTSLQSKMRLFIQDHIFSEEDEETKDWTEEAKKKIEVQRLNALHRKRCLLAAYCKLIIYNVIDMAAAAEIYKYFTKAYYDNFGDIIKETMNRTRLSDKIQSAKTMILCLQQMFQKHVESQDDGSCITVDNSTSFNNIKELARRFALSFGSDQLKSRESVAMIHKEGIEFAFQGAAAVEGKPPNINFLIILAEFSYKLLKPDKRLIYSYLLRYMPEPAFCKEDSWYSIGWYRMSLLANEDEESSANSSLNEWPPSHIARIPSFKRKLSEGTWPKTSHIETANQTSDTHYASSLPSLPLRSGKRLKYHDSSHQEHSPLLGSATLEGKNSSTQAMVEADITAEVATEDTDVDIVGAEQEI